MNFLESKKGKNFMSKLYGIGAAIVILGALFKIQHWTGADEMLIVGLGTEAIIFFVSAFEKPPKTFDWSLVYPELVDSSEENPVRELDSMLVKAKVDSELISSLGVGLRKVNEAANGLGSIVDIADSTNKYSTEVDNAAKNLQNINSLYEAQIKSSTDQTQASIDMASKMASSITEAEQMKDELALLSKNLNALNSVYGNMLNAMNAIKK